MSYNLAPIALTLGATASITLPGAGQSVSYIKITNASPYLVELTNLVSGQDYLEPGECNVWQVNGQSTAVQATPQTLLIIPGVTFSAALIVTWFVAGEPAPGGTYPVNFNMLQYIGNSVMSNSATNTIEQDLFTPFVLSGLHAAVDGLIPNQLDVPAGVALLRQSDSSLLRQAPANATFLTTIHSTTYFLDLNSDGSWSWGTSHSGQSNYLAIAQVTTDASGNISAVTDERQLITTLFNAQSGGAQVNFAGTMSIGTVLYLGTPVNNAKSNLSYDIGSQALAYFPPAAGAAAQGHYFVAWTGTTAYTPLSLGSQLNGALSWVDTAGVLHAPAPPTLISGNQETGVAGGGFTATAAGQVFIRMVSFRTHMTNVPTSITLNVVGSQNFTSLSTDTITRDGFRMIFSSVAAGLCEWFGTYTTVGN